MLIDKDVVENYFIFNNLLFEYQLQELKYIQQIILEIKNLNYNVSPSLRLPYKNRTCLKLKKT
jgi:hypothetical protein